jgi:hypothetical protein
MQSTTAEPIAAALRELDAALLPSLAATPAAYQLRAHALLRLNRCLTCCSRKQLSMTSGPCALFVHVKCVPGRAQDATRRLCVRLMTTTA